MPKELNPVVTKNRRGSKNTNKNFGEVMSEKNKDLENQSSESKLSDKDLLNLEQDSVQKEGDIKGDDEQILVRITRSGRTFGIYSYKRKVISPVKLTKPRQGRSSAKTKRKILHTKCHKMTNENDKNETGDPSAVR